MRFVPLLMLAAGFVTVASVSTEAKTKKKYEERAHYSITVRKHRSFLDAGTVVKPGSKSYQDYVGLQEFHFPSYGPINDNLYSRYPLPMPGELPGYAF
jgi:hypothetical protein